MMWAWPMCGAYGGGGGVLMVIGWLIALVLIILLIRWLIGGSRHHYMGMMHHGDKTPLQILEERYAKGEINREELEAKKKDLS